MSEANMDIDSRRARAFLTGHLGSDPSEVELVGEGAWSRCFGFRLGAEDLVIRFGHYPDDFHKDRRATMFASPDLPVPRVLDIGRAFDGYYAISTRVHGVPLESLDAAGWLAIVPAVVSALEAMRLADLSATVGIGGWGDEGKAPHSGWSGHLLAVAKDTPELRTHGWRERLAASTENEATFAWGYHLLASVASDAVPRSLLHCDLTNRNVLVDNDRLSGVFDWGCALFGDHLYELALIEFWAPWYPQLDIQHLRTALEERWRELGYSPADRDARLLACYLHIGLDHLAYNAYLRDWTALTATAERMRTLAAGLGISS